MLLLNEIGLDPGIDHCSAISLLQRLRSENKRVVSFASFCGGVPAPESAEGVPLGYKFSWSPRGVLSAALSGSRFKLGGNVLDGELASSEPVLTVDWTEFGNIWREEFAIWLPQRPRFRCVEIGRNCEQR